MKTESLRNRLFGTNGYMVQSNTLLEGEQRAGNPKQSDSNQSCLTFICFGCPRAGLDLQQGVILYSVTVVTCKEPIPYQNFPPNSITAHEEDVDAHLAPTDS